jgi:hypothetical protein
VEGLGQLKKKTLTSLGIKTATFRLEAQCLNQLRYSVPRNIDKESENTPGPERAYSCRIKQ